jgi:SAM-dependent methyltransferase
MIHVDWLELWRELAARNLTFREKGKMFERYKKHIYKKVERHDPLLDFVLKDVSNTTTVIDIGAGNGRWAIPLAKRAQKVTAVEPSEEMCFFLKERIGEAELKNVQIMQLPWEEATVEDADVIVCAHSIYKSPDLTKFIRKMRQHARKRCYLSICLPPCDGVIGELSTSIYGHPYDSPNAIIAYNALYSLGIYANVLMEDCIEYWQNSTLEEAFARAKRHLHLEDDNTYDHKIRSTLHLRLKHVNGSYIWPDGMRSALLWWKQ